MSLKYKWSVTKVHVTPQQDGKTNIVVGVDWLVTASDEETKIFASHSGTKQVALGDSFTPYEQLTEQQILNWCFEPEVEGSHTKRFKDENEAQVARQVQLKLIKQKLQPALPWANLG